MKKVKMLFLIVGTIFLAVLLAGCGSSNSPAPAPAAPQKAASSMPKEDVKPIVQDLERKLQDTLTKVKEGKWADAKIIAAEAVKTSDRLAVHITDVKMKDALSKSVKEVNDAVSVSPADQKTAEGKIATALSNVKQAGVQLQGHNH